MSLHSLIYMSSAVHLPTQAEIEHLLTRARIRNQREQVTGVLLYDEGSFMQVIEGPQEGIERVFSAVLADPLHHSVLELLREPIEERDFDGWSMAYRAIGVGLVNPDDALSAKLQAPQGDLSAVHHLLASFWNGGLGTRYSRVMDGKPNGRR